jgi:signal transduction histidine kinase
MVSDTGVGMSESVIKKLFKVGTKVSTLGTSQEKGTGLGLILCKDFVEKNGGTIGVESKEGHGSKFYFTIPVS